MNQLAEPANRGMMLVRVPISLIACEELPDASKLTALKESICRFGLLQPIAVSRNGNGYKLLYGKRRLSACKSLKFEYINAMLLSISNEDALLLPLAENFHQASLSLSEQALSLHNIAQMMQIEPAFAGQMLKIEEKQLHSILNFLKLPLQAQTIAAEEGFNSTHIATALKYKDPTSCIKAVEKMALRKKAIQKAADEPEELYQGLKLAMYSDKRLFINALRDIASQMRIAGFGGCISERDGEIIIRTAEDKITSMVK